MGLAIALLETKGATTGVAMASIQGVPQVFLVAAPKPRFERRVVDTAALAGDAMAVRAIGETLLRRPAAYLPPYVPETAQISTRATAATAIPRVAFPCPSVDVGVFLSS